MANIALPGTSSFIGELMLLLGIFKFNSTAGTISCLGVIFCGAYSLWLCNKILFGNLKNIYTLKFLDLNLKEFLILLPLFVLIVVVGLNPNVVLSFSHTVCLNILFESF
jgi:NADH:ubiquinone oxidoreductase subunit 4 (subunit M)